jgi:superfamily I DNA/RNA helicase
VTFLAVTQQTADWLLGKPGVLDELNASLFESHQLEVLRREELVEGPVRISGSENESLLCVWNADYLSGTGEENWGFIRLDGDLGLKHRSDIAREVLERCLYVINQRLQGYFLDGALIHRAQGNGAHTCLAGRGSEARLVSIGYVERDVGADGATAHAVVCVGPAFDFSRLGSAALKAGEQLELLLETANSLIDPARKRQVASADLLPDLRRVLAGYLETVAESEFGEVSVDTGSYEIPDRDSFRTVGWTYRDWMVEGSALSTVQKKLLFSHALERHPIRIVGPGGSGKTLLMQLLALRRLELAADRGSPIRILYLAHNAKMAETIRHRFSILQGVERGFTGEDRILEIQTLADYGRRELSLDETHVIDPDAHEAKEFQFGILAEALNQAIRDNPQILQESTLLREITRNEALKPIMVRMLMAEISTAIKGHGLTADEKRYVQSERRLSRLHGALNEPERRFVFDVFRRYHAVVFEGFRVLDSDDVALSLLGKMRAPLWDLKRRDLGFDYVFVDETQLFNENERRILPLLTKSNVPHVPVVLALDEAQDIYGQSTPGLAALGIANVASESLSSIHRSTRAIVQLAFFVIQRSTDLFGPEFPDFTGIAEHMQPDSDKLCAPPVIEVMPEGQERLSKFVLKRIRALRKSNLRRIAVICYADQYWASLLDELRKTDLPLRVLENRGERLPAGDPLVALSRAPYIGGQEFDGVILVGLENGLVPPRVIDNDALAVAVEQQTLRELYLGITRARFQLKVVLPSGAPLTPILADAEKAGLIKRVANRTE